MKPSDSQIHESLLLILLHSATKLNSLHIDVLIFSSAASATPQPASSAMFTAYSYTLQSHCLRSSSGLRLILSSAFHCILLHVSVEH